MIPERPTAALANPQTNKHTFVIVGEYMTREWIPPKRIYKNKARPLPSSFYKRLGVAPFCEFSEVMQAEFNAACCSDAPPPQWKRFELCMMPSRAWAEWHFRRGKNPWAEREPIDPALRKLVIERHGMKCWLCDADIAHLGDLHLDHVQPRSKGGRDTASNLRPAHALCNMRRGNRSPEEFRARWVGVN